MIHRGRILTIYTLVIMMVLGGLGQLSNWIIAPTYGVLWRYQIIMVVALIILIIPPFMLFKIKNK